MIIKHIGMLFKHNVNTQTEGSFTLAFLPRRKHWRFGHSFYVCRHGCIWQPRQANPCTLGRDVLKNRTFSIFQTASPQGFPLNLPCLNLYLWQKTCTSMAKTSDENAEQKRQCKRALRWIILYLSTFYTCVKSANPTANYALRLNGPLSKKHLMYNEKT